MVDDAFKACSCGATWGSLTEFLSAPDISFVGYQAFVRDGVLGLFLFNHECNSTLALGADHFREIRPEPVLDIPELASPFCLTHQSGEPCPEACECGWANRVIETIDGWPKG